MAIHLSTSWNLGMSDSPFFDISRQCMAGCQFVSKLQIYITLKTTEVLWTWTLFIFPIIFSLYFLILSPPTLTCFFTFQHHLYQPQYIYSIIASMIHSTEVCVLMFQPYSSLIFNLCIIHEMFTSRQNF